MIPDGQNTSSVYTTLLGPYLSFENVLPVAVIVLWFLAIAVLIGVEVMLDFQSNQKNTSNLQNAFQSFKQLLARVRWAFITVSVLVIFGAYAWNSIQNAGLEGHAIEWMNLTVRWIHVTFGIAWIGASFYFTWLEMALNRTQNLREGIAGDLWAVHGGGFYFVEKYKVAPPKIPKKLHWFMYEAYFTWISGFVLLVIVYYLNAKMFLIDPAVMDLTPTQAISLSIGSLLLSWVVYDQLCKTPLMDKPAIFGLLLFGFITLMAFILSQLFNPRAAYIHVGAIIGTMMVGNVFFVIIPSQKALVHAAKNKLTLDPRLGKNAGGRSLHNNYLTLPVLFIMISNHFPSTFGNPWNWAILAGLSLGSVAVKHFFNLHDRGETNHWLIPIAATILIGLAVITAPDLGRDSQDLGPPVSFEEARAVIITRCTQCHSSNPTDDLYTVAPNGVKYDTPEEIQSKVAAILNRAVITSSMPPANKTGITDEERELLGRWIKQGAKIK